MHLEVTFRNLRPRSEIRRRAEALYKKLHRFLDPSSEATLVVAVEHQMACLELVVTTRGQIHKATEEEEDLRTALDKLFHTMESQLRRAKERRVDRKRRDAGSEEEGFVAEDAASDEGFAAEDLADEDAHAAL